MRRSALCDQHAKCKSSVNLVYKTLKYSQLIDLTLHYYPCVSCIEVFEEPEDPSTRSFFSEIISSISDVKFSHNGRYLLTRDYLTVKVWDLQMESRPVEVFAVHDYLRSKLCSLYENDSIFDKFECVWNGTDT